MFPARRTNVFTQGVKSLGAFNRLIVAAEYNVSCLQARVPGRRVIMEMLDTRPHSHRFPRDIKVALLSRISVLARPAGIPVLTLDRLAVYTVVSFLNDQIVGFI